MRDCRSANRHQAIWLLLFSLLLFVDRSTMAQSPRSNPRQTVHGWLVHWPDPVYLDRVLSAAPKYHVNHLELSHDIIMQVDDATVDPKVGALIETVSKRARAKGIKPFIWAHEINTRDKNAPLDPTSVEGKAFWEQRREAYRRSLKACPSVAGVVLMFGSSPYEVWDRPSTPGEGDGWQRMTAAQRVRYITDLVVGVVKGEFKKEVFVRDFNHGPQQLASILEGLKNNPDITVISKAEPQDFQPFYPHSFTLGAYGSTPQIVEIDLCGEYWGQSIIPVSQAEYIPYRLKHDQEQGTIGAVGRVDCFSNSALGTPAEFNLYVYERALSDRNVTASILYAEWMEKRYHLKRGSAAAQHLTEIFARTWQVARKMYYTLGFWTWKNQTSFPENSRSIDGGIIGKSTAQWDPTQKPTEARLVHPDQATFAEIASEKAEAVALANQNWTAIATLRNDLSANDYNELERQLRLAADLAKAYQGINLAYWRVKLAENAPTCAEAETGKVIAAIDGIGPLADLLEARWGDVAFIGKQAPRLRTFQKDLTTRYERNKGKTSP